MAEGDPKIVLDDWNGRGDDVVGVDSIGSSTKVQIIDMDNRWAQGGML